MSRIIKVVKTLRNHWKKSIFFSGLALWGANYGRKKYLEFNLMKAFCEEAKVFGEERLSPLQAARHVTVILNPVANDRNSKADYEKYCAPLFHLAGFKVSLVVTEAEGQAKELMEIMDNTDCVVVAGGDGTVHEVITGLLRRKDSQNATKQFPVGIVPVGKNNFVAHQLNSKIYDSQKDLKAKILGECSMSVIRQVLDEVHVMKIEGELGRPVYSLGQLNIGQIRNTMNKLDQYWYLGQRMKPYLTFFFQSFKDLTNEWNDSDVTQISYTDVCSGCSKCYHRFETDHGSYFENELIKQANKRWWSFLFMPRSQPGSNVPDFKKLQIEKMKQTINENCDQWHSMAVSSKNIIIKNSATDQPKLELIVHPMDLDRTNFIKEGLRICKNKPFEDNDKPYHSISAKDYHLNLPVEEITLESSQDDEKPVPINEISEQQPEQNRETDTEVDNSGDGEQSSENIVSETSSVSPEDNVSSNKKWITIDNENYEIQSSLKVSLLPSKVQIYHPR